MNGGSKGKNLVPMSNSSALWPEDDEFHKRQLSQRLQSMCTTPTDGNNCFPFAINCRFSKTFFGLPKRCGYCRKIVIGIGFGCQNCSFRCHKKCVLMGRNPPCFRPKLCSLSHLPAGDDELFGKLLKENEINSNDVDVFLDCVEDDNFIERNTFDILGSSRSSSSCVSGSPVVLPESPKWTNPQEWKRNDRLRHLDLAVFYSWPGGASDTTNGSKANGEKCRKENAASPLSGQLPRAADSSRVKHTDQAGLQDLVFTFPLLDATEEAAERSWHDADVQQQPFDDFHESFRRGSGTASELGEWIIPFEDLQFGDCIMENRNMKVFKGRWHGEVMIYSYTLKHENEMFHSFFEDVKVLSKIRHVNINLFMGVSLEPSKLAVITCDRKGDTLFETVHIKGQRLPDHSKLNIARQVANGMNYLHAKGIVWKNLTSRNVSLENEVKITMLDYSTPQASANKSTMGSTSRGALTYLSPELIQSLLVEPPYISLRNRHTQESDIYAFGTILYELWCSTFPHVEKNPEQIIWFIGSGKTADLSRFVGNNSVRVLIETCWQENPVQRPSFAKISDALQAATSLQRNQSASVPERLHNLVI